LKRRLMLLWIAISVIYIAGSIFIGINAANELKLQEQKIESLLQENMALQDNVWHLSQKLEKEHAE